MSHPIERAIELCGGLKSTADALGVKYQAVQKWLRGGSVPPKRVLRLSQLSGVACSELRPDMYPPELSLGRRAPSTATKRKTG